MDADIALLQEAGNPPADVASKVDTGPAEHWDSHVWNSCWYEGRFPKLYDRWSMVVRLSDRVDVEWYKQVSPISEVAADEIAVSGIGTIAAARVTPKETKDAAPFTVVSMYARWIRPHPHTKSSSRWAIRTARRTALSRISRRSLAMSTPSTHRILAAGDLNMVFGAIDDNPQALTARNAR